MTDDTASNDSIDARPASDTDSTDDETTHSDSGRSLLKTAAAGIAGLAGLGAASGSAAADSQGSQRLVVVGKGRGRHDYKIRMGWPNEIYKADHAGPNDRTVETWSRATVADGTVWNWNVDTYTYTGPVRSVEADGDVSFYFVDDLHFWGTKVKVDAMDSGPHDYRIAGNEGDIDLIPSQTGGNDRDEGGPDSERHWPADYVSGTVWNYNRDAYDVSDQVNELHVEGGHVKFHVECPGCDPPS